MKKSLNLLFIALVFNIACFGQTTLNDAKLKAKIIALDRSGWQAWKDKDVKWFKNNTTEGFLNITSEGVSNKADVIKSTPVDCNVKSFSLDDFKFVMLDENTVFITYIATQDAECGGTKLPAKVRATVTYVKRNGKWLEALYMDTPVTQ